MALVCASALLAAYWTLGTSALRHKCTTVDEMIHLLGGCSYWQLNDYRLQPENGNLPQRWHALPLVLTGCAKLPPAEHPAWKKSDVWTLGMHFFYDNGNDPDLLLARGRMMAAVLGVATCLIVFLWSWRLFGLRGGFVSLVLAAFCPAMLAHGPLATSDMCLTLFLLASVWAIWELLHEITLLRLAGGMLAIAGLFLSKMSAPIILPIAGLLVLVRLCNSQPLKISLRGAGILPAENPRDRSADCRQAGSLPHWELRSRSKQLAAALAVTLVCGLFAYGAVWAAYGCRYSAFAEGPLTDARLFKMNDIETACGFLKGRSGSIIRGLAEHQVLPEAYLYGTAFVLTHLRRVAFLNGEYSLDGWRHYFPYCFAVKTPLALFGVLALALAGLGVGSREPGVGNRESDPRSPTPDPRPLAASLYRIAPLLVLLAVLWASAINSTFNIGYRHILPVYPTLYILCGAAGLLIAPGRRVASLAVVACVTLFAADSLAAYPNYLAYFNHLLPQKKAYQHLVDSNLDWGQDLPGLKRWLEEHNRGPQPQPAYLAYFGSGQPDYYQVPAVDLPPDAQPADSITARPWQWEPGIYCISATSLSTVVESAGGRWNRAYEERYQQRRELFGPRSTGSPTPDSRPPTPDPARAAYQYGQYLRLLAYLRHRQPDDHVGYSILIFRLNAEEIDQALNGPPAELDDQPWLPGRDKFL